MKKQFVSPVAEILILIGEDVLTLSTDVYRDDGGMTIGFKDLFN